MIGFLERLEKIDDGLDWKASKERSTRYLCKNLDFDERVSNFVLLQVSKILKFLFGL